MDCAELGFSSGARGRKRPLDALAEPIAASFTAINVTSQSSSTCEAASPNSRKHILQPLNATGSIDRPSKALTRRRNHLVKSYLALQSDVINKSDALTNTTSSYEEQVANAIASSGVLSNLASTSSRSKTKVAKRTSKAHRHASTSANLRPKDPSIDSRQSVELPRYGGLHNVFGTDGAPCNVSLQGDDRSHTSKTVMPGSPEQDADADPDQDNPGTSVSLLAPSTTVNSIEGLSSSGYILYNCTGNGKVVTPIQFVPPAFSSHKPARSQNATSCSLSSVCKCESASIDQSSAICPSCRAESFDESWTADQDCDLGSDFWNENVADEEFLDLLEDDLRSKPTTGPTGTNRRLIEAECTLPMQLPSSHSTGPIEPHDTPRTPWLDQDNGQELDTGEESALMELASQLDSEQSVIATGPAAFEKRCHEEQASAEATAISCTERELVPLIADTLSDVQEHDLASKPVVRQPFPKPVRDRSAIIGVNPTDLLRTCFRIGEALNVGSQAVRVGNSVTLEIYAKVESSYREPGGAKQHFILTDLWSSRGPSLAGVFACWKGSELWEADSRVFLNASEHKKMCRCIAKMKREDHEWKLLILNIWEAEWEDIEYIRGIVAI